MYYPASWRRPMYYAFNALLKARYMLVGQPTIKYIPELQAELQIKSLTLPRDDLQRGLLRQAAHQILKSKNINPLRVKDAVAGSIILAMIPNDQEIEALDIEYMNAARVRKNRMPGEEGLDTHWRWVVGCLLFAWAFNRLMWMVRILRSMRKHVNLVFTSAFYIKFVRQISIFLRFMLTKVVQ
nr:MAG: hypothetical protein [Skomarfal virus 20]